MCCLNDHHETQRIYHYFGNPSITQQKSRIAEEKELLEKNYEELLLYCTALENKIRKYEDLLNKNNISFVSKVCHLGWGGDVLKCFQFQFQ